jgi:hypothetical protein
MHFLKVTFAKMPLSSNSDMVEGALSDAPAASQNLNPSNTAAKRNQAHQPQAEHSQDANRQTQPATREASSPAVQGGSRGTGADDSKTTPKKADSPMKQANNKGNADSGKSTHGQGSTPNRPASAQKYAAGAASSTKTGTGAWDSGTDTDGLGISYDLLTSLSERMGDLNMFNEEQIDEEGITASISTA